MTLRNAFEGLATERTLRSLVRNLMFAKTPLDQIRVVADSGSTVVSTATYWGNGNTYPVYHSTGAPVSMDAREQVRDVSMANFQSVRMQRWSL